MSDPMKPALTPEEWERKSADAGLYRQCIDRDGDLLIESDALDVRTWPERRHALAALALHGQPFGFTREDVRLLRERAERDEEVVGIMGGGSYASPFRAIAARIEALLPPEAK